jgi:hypothetical protein
MNMPGFTAEASHYESHASYRAFPSPPTTSTLAITPQLPPPESKGCYTCRSSCYIHYPHNAIKRRECLDDCPCLF